MSVSVCVPVSVCVCVCVAMTGDQNKDTQHSTQHAILCTARRMEEELRKKQEAEEAALAKERERKRLQKQGAGTKNLSFAMDVSWLAACVWGALHCVISICHGCESEQLTMSAQCGFSLKHNDSCSLASVI